MAYAPPCDRMKPVNRTIAAWKQFVVRVHPVTPNGSGSYAPSDISVCPCLEREP